MIIPNCILSLVFLALAFLITKKNAKYLLSGYNTMSEEERSNFDLVNYIIYFKKFHIFLSLSLFSISLLLYFFVDKDWSSLFMVSYIVLCYAFFIWKSRDYEIKKTKKNSLFTKFATSGLLLLFFGMIYLFQNALKDNEIQLRSSELEITGSYGITLKKINIKSIQLITNLPKIASKIDGFGLEIVKKGNFSTESGEKVKLLINASKQPYILLITSDNQKIYYNSKVKSTQEIYNTINLSSIINTKLIDWFPVYQTL